MRAATTTVVRALAVLLVAFLSLRGAIGVWQQLMRADASPAVPLAAPDPVQIGAPSSRASTPPPPRFDATPLPRPDDRAAADTRTVSWLAIERSASFIEGHTGPVVAAFIDLDCVYCSQLWRRVRAPLATGRLRVQWIPVAVLAPARADRAAALLRATDPVAALAAHESRISAAASTSSAPVEAVAEVAANNALLGALTAGRPATPLLVARDTTQRPRILVGLPADLAAFLADAR